MIRLYYFGEDVALHPEGVDRNAKKRIEAEFLTVALHPEGVDRNLGFHTYLTESGAVALHPEGVDRNVYSRDHIVKELSSPSTRRAWIEM